MDLAQIMARITVALGVSLSGPEVTNDPADDHVKALSECAELLECFKNIDDVARRRNCISYVKTVSQLRRQI